jgi:adenylate kinase family enzyme
VLRNSQQTILKSPESGSDSLVWAWIADRTRRHDRVLRIVIFLAYPAVIHVLDGI